MYLVNSGADTSNANDWVKDNVIPHLDIAEDGSNFAQIAIIRERIRGFVGPDPEFWGYYADYDWVVFCQIFGRMINLPKGWPMYCRDIKQMCDAMGSPSLPAQSSKEHNALNDARWNELAWEHLNGLLANGYVSIR